MLLLFVVFNYQGIYTELNTRDRTSTLLNRNKISWILVKHVKLEL